MATSGERSILAIGGTTRRIGPRKTCVIWLIGRLMGELILGREPEMPLFDPGRSYETETVPA